MVILLSKAFYAYNILLEIGKEKNFPFRISYWCMKNIKEIEDNANFYITSRNELFDEYLEKDEKGNILQQEDEDGTIRGKIKEGYLEEFSSRVKELEETTCEVNPYQLELNYLLEQENFKISGQDLKYLDFLIKEE